VPLWFYTTAILALTACSAGYRSEEDSKELRERLDRRR